MTRVEAVIALVAGRTGPGGARVSAEKEHPQDRQENHGRRSQGKTAVCDEGTGRICS